MVVYTIDHLLKKGTSILKEAGCPSPYLDVQLLFGYISGYSKVDMIVNREKKVDAKTVEAYFKLIEERKKGKPIQYITGHQEFMGLEFSVQEDVLIPRPDTEVLVEKVLELLKGKKNPVIADVCTGTGAIAVSLAYYKPEAFVYASDISEAAVKCCRRNVDKHGLNHRVKLLLGDLLEPLFEEGLEGKLDVLVSNPPYISKYDMERLPVSVRGFEPHLALYGGEEGLDFYVRILDKAARLLKKGGLLAFEIGYNQGPDLKGLIEEKKIFKNVKTEKDLAGLDRVVYCWMEE